MESRWCISGVRDSYHLSKICVCVQMYMHVCMVCMCVHVYVCVYVACVHACVCICVCVCVCRCAKLWLFIPSAIIDNVLQPVDTVLCALAFPT